MITKPTYKTANDYLRDIQTDTVMNWGSVHDEIDYLVLKTDNKLHHAILKRMQEIVESKNVFDKLGMPYINFGFDIEWDEKGGTWLPFDKLNAYTYPTSRTEAKWKNKYLNGGSLPKSEKKENIETYELNLKGESLNKIEYWMQKISKLPSGNTQVTILTDDGDFKYSKLVSIDKL